MGPLIFPAKVRAQRKNEAMKVLHICEVIKGGIATYLSNFDTNCRDRVESRFIVPVDQADQLPAEMHILPFNRDARGVKSVWQLAVSARRVAREFKPDIIMFHSTFSLGAMALLRLGRIPGSYVYCPHGWARLRYTESPNKARIVSTVEGQMVGLSDLVLNISKNDKNVAEYHAYRGRHIVVENALSDLVSLQGPSPFPKDPDRIDLLFVGRFERQKGLDILLGAFPSAHARNPALHLHIVGASDQKKSDIQAFSNPNVTFHDWVPPARICDYYAYADLLVMPSRWEGLPMVMIEALRAGTPVMVADTSGLGELIDEKESGFVVSPNSESFAQSLGAIDRPALEYMRPKARLHFETRFGPERFKTETLRALSDVLRNRSLAPEHSQRQK